jgi:hypothetical protein
MAGKLTPTTRPTAPRRHAARGTVESVFDLLSIFVDRFGMPGTALIFGAWFVNQNATVEQKRAIIGRYVLGDGLSPWWPLIIISVVAIFVVWAQSWRHKQKIAAMSKRLDELAAEKSRLQELLAGRGLRHGDEFDSGEGE